MATVDHPATIADQSEWRALIDRYQVCYEVWPEWAILEGRKVQVGFELDLCATSEKPSAPGLAGDPPGLETFEKLKELATSILPPEKAEADFEILPYDNSVHESPRRHFRPEVVLDVQILHQHGSEQPLDDCELQCLQDVERRLRELGVRRAN